MATQIFINLVVNDLEKTKAFWSSLGYFFNPQFTDQHAACLVLSDTIYAMLMTPESMKRFTTKNIADTATTLEVINAISVESREKADDIAAKAIAAGGKQYREPDEYGWMYSRSIEDIDGHVWEFFYADISKIPQNPQ